MKNKSETWHIVSWVIGVLFVALGILYFIFVHPVPALIYLVLSIIYIPPLDAMIKRRFGFSIPIWIKIILAFLIIWYTLAVGELIETDG
jgi:hypothetical protein